VGGVLLFGVASFIVMVGVPDCGDGAEGGAAGAGSAAGRAGFDAQNELEDLIARVARGETPASELDAALLDATVWVVAPGDIREARSHDQKTMSFQHVAFRGRSMLPLYTARDRVPSDAPAQNVGTLPVAVILEHLDPPSPIVLNPGSALPVSLSADQVARLRARVRGEPEPDRAKNAAPEPLPTLPMAEPAPLLAPLRSLRPQAGERDDPVGLRRSPPSGLRRARVDAGAGPSRRRP